MRYRHSLLVFFLALPAALAATGECTDPSALPAPGCGLTPTPAFDRDARLWVAFVQHGHVYVTHSGDLGKTFSWPVAVNPAAEPVHTNGENRPKIAIGPGGEIYVSWTKKTPGRYTGDIRFSRSLDGGATFEPPRTVNDDGLLTSHRFETLRVTASGRVYLAWLDKRDKETAAEKGSEYTGAAVYYAVSGNRGKTFSANRKVADHSCECCRIGAAPAGDDGVMIFWRHIFDNRTRDHAVAVLNAKRGDIRPRRATFDGWEIDACPHHGPAIAAGGEGHHLAWFTGAPEHPGIHYAHLHSGVLEPEHVTLIDSATGAAHPHVLEDAGGRVHLVWKRFDGAQTQLLHAVSTDAGSRWSEPASLATTGGASDHPLLVASGGRGVFVSWQTDGEGYRLLEIRKEGGETAP